MELLCAPREGSRGESSLGENVLLTAHWDHNGKQLTLEGTLGFSSHAQTILLALVQAWAYTLGIWGLTGDMENVCFNSESTCLDGLFLSVEQLQNTASPTIYFIKNEAWIHEPSEFSHWLKSMLKNSLPCNIHIDLPKLLSLVQLPLKVTLYHIELMQSLSPQSFLRPSGLWLMSILLYIHFHYRLSII